MDDHSSGGLTVTTTTEGREIENLLSSLDLSQLISETTNFEANKNPLPALISLQLINQTLYLIVELVLL